MTEEESIDLLLDEVGRDEQKPEVMEDRAPIYWANRDTTLTPAGSDRHRLLVKKDLILLAMGLVRNQVNFRAEGDVSYDASDRMEHLRAMLADVKEELAAGNTAPPVTEAYGVVQVTAGELLTNSSTSMRRPQGSANANSIRFRGSPYRPGRRYP